MRHILFVLLLSLLPPTWPLPSRRFGPGELWPDNNGSQSTVTGAGYSSMAGRSTGSAST